LKAALGGAEYVITATQWKEILSNVEFELCNQVKLSWQFSQAKKNHVFHIPSLWILGFTQECLVV
jgi:hypothetical protein